ncbi:hypothetical protein JB92DRAFT_2840601 [Gautieria morchelliformis]|nr:hypothetical protein JB92DRAFT_2840601 [Gautieria morchelliformis]
MHLPRAARWTLRSPPFPSLYPWLATPYRSSPQPVTNDEQPALLFAADSEHAPSQRHYPVTHRL